MKKLGKVLLKIINSKLFKVIFGLFLVLFIGYFFYTAGN